MAMYIAFIGGSWLWDAHDPKLQGLPNVINGNMLGEMVGPFASKEEGTAYLKQTWPLDDAPDADYAALVFEVESPGNWIELPFADYSVDTIGGILADTACRASGHEWDASDLTRCKRCGRTQEELR